MTPIPSALFILGLLAGGAALGLLVQQLVHYLVYLPMERAEQAIREADDETMRQQTARALEELEAAQVAFTPAMEEAERFASYKETAERRIREYQDAVVELTHERDAWNRRYWDASIQHGNAQSMMMEERQRLIQQVYRAGLKPAVNPKIEAVAADFQAQHADPARAAVDGPPPKDAA